VVHGSDEDALDITSDIVGDIDRSTLDIRDRIEPVAECSCDDPCYDHDVFDETQGESGNMPLDPTMWVHCLRCYGKAPGLWAFNWDGDPTRLPRHFEWVTQ